ncbi:MAG: hypothetical protein KGL90_03080 [Burkholderiales bacterium]|nr:hypothetical protein [Burkholderiales bacterium]
MSLPSELFVYVKIPGVIEPSERGRKYEERIDQALGEQGCGSVAGWGSSLGNAQADGSRAVEFHRIDIDVTDPTLARSVLQQLLPTLGAPPGTEIHYTRDQAKLQDVYTPSGWVLDQPIANTHRRHGTKSPGR